MTRGEPIPSLCLHGDSVPAELSRRLIMEGISETKWMSPLILYSACVSAYIHLIYFTPDKKQHYSTWIQLLRGLTSLLIKWHPDTCHSHLTHTHTIHIHIHMSPSGGRAATERSLKPSVEVSPSKTPLILTVPGELAVALHGWYRHRCMNGCMNVWMWDTNCSGALSGNRLEKVLYRCSPKARPLQNMPRWPTCGGPFGPEPTE